MFSINHGVSDPGLLAKNRKYGFFRADAALAVVFISDENDICAKYPAGVTPVPDSWGIEPKAFKMFCGGITAEGVYSQLKKLQGDRPLAIGAIIYTGETAVPKGIQNEIGYGYTDMVRVGNGVAID